MRFALCVVSVAALAVLLSDHPAAASISGATLSTNQPSYAGPCPTTIGFSGSVTGTPGTLFTYSFNRFINGVQQIANGGTVTMPGSGTIAVNDSISLSSNASGKTFDQIWVHNIVPSQADVYGNIVNFSVTCGAPPTPPPQISAPTNLTSTVDATLCSQHTLFCATALSAGQLAFIWSWPGPGTLTGYKLYRVDSGHHDVAEATSAGEGSTGTFLAPPSDGFNGRCYAVTAYRGGDESTQSNTFCIGGGTATNPRTSTLSALHLRGIGFDQYGRTGVFGSKTIRQDTCAKPLCVGWEHSYTESILGDTYSNWYWRSGMMFDVVGALHPTQILRAVLHMHINGGLQGDPEHWQSSFANCTEALGMATSAWWSGGAMDGNFSYYVYYGQPGTDLAIDITTIAKQWAGGAPNYGVVIKGADENLGAFSKGSCITYFDGNPTLEVVYL